MKDGRTDGRQEVEVLMALVMMEAEVPGAGERPQALFTQVNGKEFSVRLSSVRPSSLIGGT